MASVSAPAQFALTDRAKTLRLFPEGAGWEEEGGLEGEEGKGEGGRGRGRREGSGGGKALDDL